MSKIEEKVNETEIKKGNNEMSKIEEKVNETEIEKEAQETAKKVKVNTIRIKIPVDPMNPKDLMVPVVINGYQWLIKRGETVEVPEQVAKILEDAKYI